MDFLPVQTNASSTSLPVNTLDICCHLKASPWPHTKFKSSKIGQHHKKSRIFNHSSALPISTIVSFMDIPKSQFHLCIVLCHHSPRWISLTFREHPLYSVSNPYICTTALYGPCSSLPSPTLLTSTFCFWLTFAYARAKPPEPCHWLICNRHIYHVCMSRSQARPCGSITSETSCGMWWKPRQWRF